MAQLERGQRHFESFDSRMLTSGVYIHGLSAWGTKWPRDQLLVLRSEDLFADTIGTMARVQKFLGLERPFPRAALAQARNRNTASSRSKPSARLNAHLDRYFAPHNERLYEWLAARGIAFPRWETGGTKRR